MRRFCVLVLLASVGFASDAVHLKNGRILYGEVVSESDREVVVRMGAGRVSLPRAQVRAVERNATARPVGKTVTRRDEWSLVLHREKLAGWRRVVHTEGPERVLVEERTVFFRAGGGDDVDIRRVEVADREGRPLEFLLMETYGNEMDLVSGERSRNGWNVRVTRAGVTRTITPNLGRDWVLQLPAWSCFLRDAAPGEVRTVRALDLRNLQVRDMVLRRHPDESTPNGRRPWRAISLAGDFRQARALYRPGEGAWRVELNGPSLVARRSTRERVELARAAHAAPEPLSLDQAHRFPFHERPENLTAYHPRAGFRIDAPDAGWLPEPAERDNGLVLTFEKIALYSSMEIFAWPVEGESPDPDACLRRALARLRLTAERVRTVGEPREVECGGSKARCVELAVRHRGEDLHCLLYAVPARGRSLVLLGAAPERWWRWAERDFRAFAKTLEVVP